MPAARMRHLIPLAFMASVAVHLGLLLLVQRAVIAHRAAAAAHGMKTQQVVLLPPPDPEPPPPVETPKPEPPKPPPPRPKPDPEPEPKPELEQQPAPREVSLGIDAPNPPSEVWLGYKDFLEQFAAPSKVDQAAFTDKPVMAAPTPPVREQENASTPPAAENPTPAEEPTERPDHQDPPPTPTEALPPQPTDTTAAATDAGSDPQSEPLDLSRVLQSMGLRVPDLVRPESRPPEGPQPQDGAGDQPQPAKPGSIADERDGDPDPDGSDALPAIDGALTPKNALSPGHDTASAKAAEAPAPPPAATRPATRPDNPPEDLVAKESVPRPKPHPTPPPRSPASPSASDLAIWRASTGELRMGAQADKESDASSVIVVPRDQWRLGKPLAGRGIELKPRRPEFTELMRLTSAPENPLVQISFASDGVPVDARILKSSGDNRIDEAITSSLYRWRAAGDDLKKLSPRGTVQVTMRIIINGRASSDD